jgi:hypothetical protein
VEIEPDRGDAQDEDDGYGKEAHERVAGPDLHQEDVDRAAGYGGGRVDLATQDQGHLRAENVAHHPAGGAIYVLLVEIGAGAPFVSLLPIAIVFALRVTAIRLDLHVPPLPPKDG